MNREQLEAVVRAQLTRVVANALASGVPSTAIMNRATGEILKGADDYGVTEYGVTARRRAALAEAIGETVHFGDRVHVCGTGTIDTPPLTTDPAKVTCARCKRTRAWRSAAATVWDAMAGAAT